MTFGSDFPLASPTGATLRVYRELPQASPHAVVQINHGLAEHAARYARFAAFLAARGIAAYAHDHRGHGLTTASDAPRGTFARENGVETVLDDVLAVHQHIAENHPGVPVVLFGHSMGGLIAMNFLQRHAGRVAAAAIWNANFSAGPAARLAQAILLYERFRLGSDVPSRLLPRLTFQAWGAAIAGALTPFDWLSHDEAEVAKYVADPACGWNVSVGMWHDVFAWIVAGAKPDRLAAIPPALPMLLVGGAEDPATDNGSAVTNLAQQLARAGRGKVTTRIYPATRHETLNELCRDQASADFAVWVEGVLGQHSMDV